MKTPIPELQAFSIDASVDGLPYCQGEDGNIIMRDGKKAKLDGVFPLRKGFVQYANGFSKDDKAVYCWGYRLAGANPATFRALSYAFATDGTHVWTHMGKVKGADAATFMACDNGDPVAKRWGDGYGKDCNSVYFSSASSRARRVIKANPETFESCGEWCNVGFDDRFVFAEGASIPKAKRKTWHYLAHNYSRDENSFFYLRHRIEEADPHSFQIVPINDKGSKRGAPLAKDNNHYYWGDSVIDNDEFGAEYWMNSAVVSDANDMPPIARQLGWKLKNIVGG